MITGNTALAFRSNFTRESLRKLAGEGSGPRLSLFMPLFRTGREVRQAPILLKDMRSRAESALEERGCMADEIAELLAPVDRILEETDFGLLQGEGLAVLSSREYTASFLMPIAPAALVEAGRRFLLDPLLPLLFEDGRFHLLTLSLNSVKLWWVDRQRMREIPLHGIPANLREAVRAGDPLAPTIFHTAEKKRDILDFFHQVDRGLRALLYETELPLMLAGVEYLLPIYREANTHPFLMDHGVMGNPEVSLEQQGLHAKAWSAYRESRAMETARILNLYRERLATTRAVSGFRDVLPAARQGRVQHLFIRKGLRQKGGFDPDTGSVTFNDRPAFADEDLVNLACVHALMGGAKVYLLEAGAIPERAEIAALCRY
jgi:hypothetical protein